MREIQNLPVLPLRGLVVFPNMMVHLDVGRKKSKRAITKAMRTNQLIFVTAQKDPAIDEPIVDDLFSCGVVARVVQVLKENKDVMRVVIQGLYRAHISFDDMTCSIEDTVPDSLSVYMMKERKFVSTPRSEALIRSAKTTFDKYMSLMPKLPQDIQIKVDLLSNTGDLADFIAANIFLELFTKQTILEVMQPDIRLEVLIQALENEIYILSMEQEILEKAKDSVDRTQREFLLREQKKIIDSELGEGVYADFEPSEYRKKVEKLNLPENVKEVLNKEINKLEKTPFGTGEGSLIQNYIETVLDLPWNVYTEDNIDLEKVQSDLDKDHYGLKKVKERIIEMLAVRKLNDNAKGQIICLLGPPGTGKTSIAISIAKSIGRNYSRISLGGVKDEAEIRGHRKTYIGSMPGRIISGIKQAKSSNPLLILDEIDKLSNDYKGDPTSALLEVLDPEQNTNFVDHYLDVPFDLSKVMFITTANDYDSIPAPLRDRMEIIELSSYTRVEKLHIAKNHLIPKQLVENGLNKKNFKLTDKAIYLLIDGYTKEAGVRNLERTLASIMRKAAINVVKDSEYINKITDKDIESLLGPIKYLDDETSNKNEIGLVNGLAWTSVGGCILPIECAILKGTGKLELTGSLGDVMQESAKAAISCIRARCSEYEISPDFYKDYDIHVHAPDGATPKDGPSAGITMALALYSALTLSPVRHDFAMTGEITLRGKVLPIGGLREKAMAAYKAKIKNLIIPKENLRDLYDIEDEVKKYINFIPVESIDEVISLATIKSKKVMSRDIKPIVEIQNNKSKNISIRQ